MVFTDKDGGLPPGQPCIQTSTLRSFVGMTRLLADSQYSRAMIGIAVGESGIGKSVGICSYQQEASSRSIAITVPPRPTPHALIGCFMTAFEGKTCARQHSITLDDLFETIEHQNRRLVILDGADYLNDPCLDLLCTLFDRMQRPLLLVSLPQLLQRSLNHSRLFDRIGLTLRLPPLSYEEVLQVVLPALELPGWEFNVGQEADYLLGEQLWEYSYPSLRRLSNLLQAASTLALREHEPRVTESYIRYAMQRLEYARQREAQRRLVLLGDLANRDYDYDRLRERARQICVPSQNLLAWWLTYREYGLSGLLPSHWMPLDMPLDEASEMGCSEKRLWNYLADYREFGLQGLAPRERSDKGRSHIISPRMRNVIKGLLLPRRKRLSINRVYAEACKRARALGEPEPSKWQIRAISASIPKSDKLLAEGREKDFKSKYAITYSLAFLEEWNPQIIFEIDHTQIDVLAKDIRPPKYRTKSGEIRPWLTLCLERRSRLIMAAIFSYDRPDQYTVAAAIRAAILVTDDKPYGGLPDVILVDNGKELLSHHIQHITQGLHIMLKPCIRHQPQQKGKVERMFGTLNTRLWSDEPGYVDSNVQKRNPHAKAELTISRLEKKLQAFIAQYNNEVHSQLRGRTPLEYWHERCFADPIDDRDLDPLLMKRKTCKAQKPGINYLKRLYWHRALADFIGKQVQVRSAPNYAPPDDIEVFYDNIWICTAFAIDSEVGKAITAKEVGDAQRDQRELARERIREAREAVENIDTEIAALRLDSQEKSTHPLSQPPQTSQDEEVQQAVQTPMERKDTNSRASNFLDVLSAHYEGRNQGHT